MLNHTVLWLLLVPVVLGLSIWYVNRDRGQDILKIGAMFTVVGIVLTVGMFFVGKGAMTHDWEIWNGKVISKDRVHDSYQRRYDCNCRTVTTRNSDGTTSSTQQCDTCYEDRYTVTWKCDTTVGEYEIEKLDRGTRAVYKTPDPERYTSIKPGDPAAKRKHYVNYVQAVPNSLFTAMSPGLKAKFANLIPAYPDDVYDFYNLSRVLTPGFSMPDVAAWNQDLALMLRDIGPAKQVNAIIVIARTDDPNYEYALRDAWEGANKNDVVVVIGASQYPKIDFVRVISWTKAELFKIQLADRIEEMGQVNRQIIPTIHDQIAKNFERRKMSEFEYLDAEIDPPNWLIITLLIVLVIGAGLTHYHIRNPQGFNFRKNKFLRR